MISISWRGQTPADRQTQAERAFVPHNFTIWWALHILWAISIIPVFPTFQHSLSNYKFLCIIPRLNKLNRIGMSYAVDNLKNLTAGCFRLLFGLNFPERVEYYTTMEVLQHKRDVGHAKLQELKETGDDAREKIKSGMEKGWPENRTAFNEAVSKFKSATPSDESSLRNGKQ